MNLKKLQTIADSVKKINDGAEQRQRHKAVNLLVKAGVDKDNATEFVNSLYHRIPALKDKMRPYITGVITWYINGYVDLTKDKDCSRVNTILRSLAMNIGARDELGYDFYSELRNRVATPEEVKQELELDSTESNADLDDITGHSYKVVRIHNYKELQKYKKWTSKWCITNSDEAFNDYTFNGVNKLYLCLRDDYKDLQAIPGDKSPYDAYGLSILAVIMDPDSQISSLTSRWNSPDEVDLHMSTDQLEDLIGEDEMDRLYTINN